MADGPTGVSRGNVGRKAARLPAGLPGQMFCVKLLVLCVLIVSLRKNLGMWKPVVCVKYFQQVGPWFNLFSSFLFTH